MTTTTSIFNVDYRSPPSGDGAIETPDGRLILLTSEGNEWGLHDHPQAYSEVRHFPKDTGNGGDDLALWLEWIQFNFQEFGVDRVNDCELNYEGDKGHLIGPDGNYAASDWIEEIKKFC